jgi:hypothetical protein
MDDFIIKDNEFTFELMKKYEEQRKDRLRDYICEVLDEEEYGARRIYEEFLFVLNEEISYREKGYEKVKALKELMEGRTEFNRFDI